MIFVYDVGPIQIEKMSGFLMHIKMEAKPQRMRESFKS
jgi:hypothetical protein